MTKRCVLWRRLQVWEADIFPKRNPCLVMPEGFKWGLSSLLVVIRSLVSSAVETLDFFP